MQRENNRAIDIVKDPAVMGNIEQYVREHFGVTGAAPAPQRSVAYIHRTPGIASPEGNRPLPTSQEKTPTSMPASVVPIAAKSPPTASGKRSPCLCKARLVYGHLELVPDDDVGQGLSPRASSRSFTPSEAASALRTPNASKKKSGQSLKKLLKAKELVFAGKSRSASGEPAYASSAKSASA
ncbi:uncharacterized protein LOC135383285 isoform X2 [Ornithodoros turicata]|uniref:uncharacterized protein LOC135383285 isoform X2 n=1 Tax=Ornithodoros turicata TaxID=34597 RepID=UPI003139809D